MSELQSTVHSEEHWITISDLMSGLMVVFMFIAVAFVSNIAITYEELQTDLYEDLRREFEDDLPAWGAVLDRSTLSVRFKEPEVLFGPGQAWLQPRFQSILTDFFPRYIAVLTTPKYVNEIEEVRIEGHTSSEWERGVDGLEAYVNNMKLSQDRTRSVLAYVMRLGGIDEHEVWLSRRLTANGLSSSHLIYTEDGAEDYLQSRRVEFRVRTNAESRIRRIIEGESDEAG